MIPVSFGRLDPTFHCDRCGGAGVRSAASFGAVGGDGDGVNIAALCADCLATWLDLESGYRVSAAIRQWRFSSQSTAAMREERRRERMAQRARS